VRRRYRGRAFIYGYEGAGVGELVHAEGCVEILGRPRKEDGLRTPRMGAVSKSENGVRTIIGGRDLLLGGKARADCCPAERAWGRAGRCSGGERGKHKQRGWICCFCCCRLD